MPSGQSSQLGPVGEAVKFGGHAPDTFPSAFGVPSIGLSSFMPQIPQAQFDKLMGPEPWQDWRQSWWNAGMEKYPIPKWDGKNPARRLRPWLRQLREWRNVTTLPLHRHGYMLKKSFPEDSWLMQAADRVPEEMIFTNEC